jgi:hypothetical protein
VIVTSRFALHGFAGAQIVALDPLGHDESLHLLARIIGPARLEAERQAAERIVHLCGRLPLALRCAGSRLAAGQGLTLAKYADRLADPHTRLADLHVADLDVRAAFRATYDRLGEPERSLFRLLGLLQTSHITADQATALLGCESDHAERLLARLSDCSLLDARPGPFGEVSYAIHELVRLYARECLAGQLEAYGRAAPENHTPETRPVPETRPAPHDRSAPGARPPDDPPARPHVPEPAQAPLDGTLPASTGCDRTTGGHTPTEYAGGGAARILGP